MIRQSTSRSSRTVTKGLMPEETLVRHELWKEPDGFSFFAAYNAEARKLLDPDAVLVWSCMASTWEEANALKHRHLGWEPYRPMP